MKSYAKAPEEKYAVQGSHLVKIQGASAQDLADLYRRLHRLRAADQPDLYYHPPADAGGSRGAGLSGGQLQRIAIARALLLDPRVLICDECTSSLDVSLQAQILNLLISLKREIGVSMIFISHDISVVRYISDRIMVMKDGHVVECGNSDEIIHNPQNSYTKTLVETAFR